MGLEHLLTALERDAGLEARGRVEEARRSAHTIATTAAERLRRLGAERLAGHEARLRGETQAKVAEARRQARALVLNARQRFLDRVFAAAAERFGEALRGEAGASLLAAQVAGTLPYLGGRPAIIRCPAGLVGRVRTIAAGSPNVRVEADPLAASGVRVAAADGSVEIDGTLEGRLERLRPQLAITIIRLLESRP